MILSELKGKRGLRTVGKLIAFAESMAGRPEFKAFADSVKDLDGSNVAAVRALLKLGAMLDDDETCDRLARIVAYGLGEDEDEFAESGDVNAELMELLTKDVGSLGFLSDARDAVTA